MTHPLKGIEYREFKVAFPNYMYKDDRNYEEWKSAEEEPIGRAYPSGTQFRVKPVVRWDVDIRDSGATPTCVKTREDLDKLVAELLDAEQDFKIKTIDLTQDIHELLFNRNVQFSTAGSEKWQSTNNFNFGAATSRITFRVRPDNYWEVTTTIGISKSTVSFDDVDKLAVYMDKQIRTNNNANSITIAKKNYV